jgi:hypothetical protein
MFVFKYEASSDYTHIESVFSRRHYYKIRNKQNAKHKIQGKLEVHNFFPFEEKAR